MSEQNPSILSHVSIGTNQFEQAVAFYDRVLATLGCKRVLEHPGAVAWGREYPEFWVQAPIDGQPANVGNGTHFGFVAPDKQAVHAFYEAALEAAEQLKLDFLANVSYQLRTPLNAIIGFSELLDHQYFGTLNERQLDYARGITEAGQRLLSLVDDILDLSTIEAGYLEIIKDVIDVESMVSGVYHLTEEWARKSQHHFNLNIAKNLGTFQGDERRLKQALLNLIRNAIDAMAELADERILRITACPGADGCVVLAVSDRGPGLAEAIRADPFAPFLTTKPDGVGLGLPICRTIVENHGGRLWVEHGSPAGTTFCFTLPTLAG